jgi:hypothetical protein
VGQFSRAPKNLSHLGYADFLLGAVASWNAGYIPITGARQMDPQVFIQDDFKALPNGQIQFRFDATNALNHTSYGIPNASIGGSTVGKITSAALSGRVLQLGARLSS